MATIAEINKQIQELKDQKSKAKSNNKTGKVNKLSDQIETLKAQRKELNQASGTGKFTGENLADQTSEDIFGISNDASSALAKSDIAQGNKIGEDLINRFMPDIDTIGGLLDTSRSEENADLLSKLDAMAQDFTQRATEGFSQGEKQGLRENANASARSNVATLARQQARVAGSSGVRGAGTNALAAQNARTLVEGSRGVERDIQGANVQFQQAFGGLANQARSNQSQTLGQVRGEELKREAINIDQQKAFAAGQNALHVQGTGQFLGQQGSIRGGALAREGIEAAREGANLNFLAQQNALGLATEQFGFVQGQAGRAAEDQRRYDLQGGFIQATSPGDFSQILLAAPAPGQTNGVGTTTNEGLFFPKPGLIADGLIPGPGQSFNGITSAPNGGIVL